jgi:hypothetical protein
MLIRQGVKLIERAHHGLASSWEDLWCLGIQRSKILSLSLPPKPSTLLQAVEHSRTKHIAIRYHFLRDHQQKGDIEISYINTKEQLANIFTKPLDEQSFTKLRHELNILDSRNFD